jgi:nucleoside 2-deoxyribosyltransferase
MFLCNFSTEWLHTHGMSRIYLAGPDVFRVDASQHFALLAAMCEKAGLKALSPFDSAITPSTAPASIYLNNMALIRSADGLVANLAPFRGAEPDSGTVFEVGAAVALGTPVVGYGVSGVYADQVRKQGVVQRVDGTLKDANGLAVEDYGLPLNLMLSRSVELVDSAEDAIRRMAEILRRSRDA